MDLIAFFDFVGTPVKDLILGFSSFLTAAYAPGLAVIALLVALVFFSVTLLVQSGRFCAATRAASKSIERPDMQRLSGAEIETLNGAFKAWIKDGSPDKRRVGIAWGEFEETLVRWQSTDGETRVGNAVRPAAFFNLTDMDVSLTKWRALPGVFVTVGLLLTFLGLIAALQQTDVILSGGAPQEALGTLLTVASAKFIMSLTGLACSIVFGFILRGRIVAMDRALHRLCAAVEGRLGFVSAEELAGEQLKTMRDQAEQTRALITKKVAEMNEPLRDAISEGIASAMQPVVQQIGSAGSEGVGAMVNDLSTRFTEDVAGALGSVSDRLSAAGTTLETLVGRMDQSSNQMGGAMEAAISRLASSVDDMRDNAGAAAQQTSAKLTESAEALFAGMRDALEQIKTNTETNGAALDRAAVSMTEAASAFRTEMNAAAQEGREAAAQEMSRASAEAATKVGAVGLAVTASMETSLAAVTNRAEELSAKVSGDLFGPLDAMREALTQAADRAAQGSTDMARFSEGAERGAASVRTAAELMGETAKAMAGAATPIRDTAERFEKAARETAQSTSATAETMKSGAHAMVNAAQSALEAGRKTLGAEREAIEANLTAIKTALDTFEGVAGRFDDIDEKLGKAFSTYKEEVETTVANIGQQSREVHNEYTRALDTLRTVVDKAEAYQPQQRR